jgi:tetratricopeptide (TPR) repeat protein
MSEPAVATSGRPADLRLARLHLRLGSLELARAELEAFAGAGRLDPEALLDLAEVRWRTGDVAGAGVAAEAYLGEDGAEPLALVIAAEASAALGRPAEARRLAAQALEHDIALDRLFAGIPRSGVWPIEPDDRPEPAGELFAIPAAHPGAPSAAMPPSLPSPVDGSAEDRSAGVALPIAIAATSSLWDTADATDAGATDVGAPGGGGSGDVGIEGRPVVATAPVAASLTAHAPAGEIDAARIDLLAGRTMAAATRLGIALRLDPSLASDVLMVLKVASTGRRLDPALELVRGDAYRQAGHEAEARRSYEAAAAAIGATRSDA